VEFFPFTGEKQPKMSLKMVGREAQSLFSDTRRPKLMFDFFEGLDCVDKRIDRLLEKKYPARVFRKIA
jgi:hypothetical protein